MNLKFWQKKPAVVPKAIFRGNGSTIRAQVWRQTPALLREADAILQSPRFQNMLEVLRNEDPARFPLAAGCPLQDRAVHQAMSEGYSLAIEMLLSLGKPWDSIETPEETFEVEIHNKNTNDL